MIIILGDISNRNCILFLECKGTMKKIKQFINLKGYVKQNGC